MSRQQRRVSRNSAKFNQNIAFQMDLANYSSDGEITNDLSDISEDEYFNSLADIIEKRKLELEVMNELEGRNYDDYSKENHYANNRNYQSSSTVSRKRAVESNFINNNHSSGGGNKGKPRDLRNRSYRASSVFSTSYTIPKRKTRRKKKYSKQPQRNLASVTYVNLSSNEEASNDVNGRGGGKGQSRRRVVGVNKRPHAAAVESASEEEDEELLSLRLQALTSKQEVKELIEPSGIGQSLSTSPLAVPSQENLHLEMGNEEELLRIAALRSAVLKKKDHIRARKKLRKLENDRPYSPTDDFEPITFDDAMELGNSPFGSPLNHIDDGDDMNQEDMDISTSPSATHEQDDHETSDMEIASPLPIVPHKPLEDFKPPAAAEEFEEWQPEKIETQPQEEENEEDLRSMVLFTMNEKKKDQKNITKNLKMAVERLKQQKQPAPPLVIAQKSGTKTIKMILEEKKGKANQQHTPQTSAVNSNQIQTTESIEIAGQQPKGEIQRPAEVVDQTEVQLLTQIINSEPQETYSKPASPATENTEVSFSTITDTKNIPLLPQSPELAKSKNNRLITSLESVIKPVAPLVIVLRPESSDDESLKSHKRKTRGEAATSTNAFEQNLNKFLKNIRMSQERKPKPPPPVGNVRSTPTTTTSTSALSKVNVTKSKSVSTKVTESAVKHLPLSAQVEYEGLLKKMKLLQQKKKQRQLKRTKSTSGELNSEVQPAEPLTLTQSKSSEICENQLKQQVDSNKEPPKSSNKIDDALSKIPLLDEAARQRLIEKTETNLQSHSQKLVESTEKNLQILEEGTLQIKQRKMAEIKIQELEKSLAKYKSFLKVVNTRIKATVPRVIQSQRDMINCRNQEHKFEQICKRVGKSVRGEDYRPPEHQSVKIAENFLKISEKTEQLQHVFKEQYASKQFKLLADKVKSFVPENKIQPTENLIACEEVAKAETLIMTKDTEDESCDIKSEESQKKEEEEESRVTVTEADDMMRAPPEVEMKSIKRVLQNMPSIDNGKRVKIYDSPLEYLKDSNSSSTMSKSVHQVVCPFALEGSCTDEKCKMLHL